MLPLVLTALSLTPPPPPPPVEPEPPAVKSAPPATKVFLYTAALKLLTMDLNAELEVQLNESAAVFADGGVSLVGWDWQMGARYYFPLLEGAGPWLGFLDGHVSQHHLQATSLGSGIGFGGAAGVRIVIPAGLAISLGARADFVTTQFGPLVLPELRVSLGWGF